jgi:hypothetical protein
MAGMSPLTRDNSFVNPPLSDATEIRTFPATSNWELYLAWGDGKGKDTIVLEVMRVAGQARGKQSTTMQEVAEGSDAPGHMDSRQAAALRAHASGRLVGLSGPADESKAYVPAPADAVRAGMFAPRAGTTVPADWPQHSRLSWKVKPIESRPSK